jgi:putative transposase
MPRKPKPDSAGEPVLQSISKELVDRFTKGPMTAEVVQIASAAFKNELIELALGAERGHHCGGYPKGAGRLRNTTMQVCLSGPPWYDPILSWGYDCAR